MAHPDKRSKNHQATTYRKSNLFLLSGLTIALWLALIFATFQQHELTRQTTSQFRLLNLSSYAVSAATNMRNELLLSSQAASHETSGKTSTDTDRRLNNAKTAIENFEKSWGRFNAASYGPAFLDQMGQVIARINARQSVLEKLDMGAEGVRKAHQYTSDVIALMYRTLIRFNAFDQAGPGYRNMIGTLNANFSSAMRLETLASVLDGTDRPESEKSASIEAFEKSIDRLKTSGITNLRNGQIRKLSDQVVLIARQMKEASAAGRPADTAAELKWIEAVTALHTQLATYSHQLATTIYESSQQTALQSHYLVVLTLVLAILASIVLLTWLAPAHYRSICLGSLLLFDAILVLWSRLAGPDFLAWERGPMEFLQAVVLAVAFALFSLEVARNKNPVRIAAIPFAVICFVMFFREFDFRIYGGPEWLIELTTGIFRRVVNASLLAAVTIYLIWHHRSVRGLIREHLKPRVWPLIVWPALLVIGEYIEHLTHETRKDDLPGFWEYGQFWEEFMELNGYLVLLYGATIFADIFRQRAQLRSN